jgi:sister-chromatid-cohesion protein PDS5
MPTPLKEMRAKVFLVIPPELFNHVIHCTQDPAFKRYFYLLENLAYVKSFNMCFDLEDCTEIFVALFTLMFKIVNDEHSGKVKNFILDVLCPLITEADYVSSELLDIILQNIVEPAKSQRKNAYNLAKDLVIKTSDTLEPYIQQFFNQVGKK